ncbi:MAG: AbrB family transcriptional regulator [Nanoarchaeota archaeon]|nr:AbrB family transcriptional regulator [Nanoarchaeota archaeon]MBU1501380.1 AbrB family transcriptional regulator [Nanoarchaeota archaeon]MBU2458822.1 AbrB family transcriptional regulator [Nanoarchaeota archaeon]
MEKIVSFDKQGRLYIPEELRRILKVRTLRARVHDESILIEPIEEDPLEALGKLGKERLKGKSIEKLKKEARGEIEKDAAKKIRGF